MVKSKDSEPCYVISVAARMLNMRTYTLRYYEKVGLVEPSRSHGNIRLYSIRDINKLRKAKELIEDLGVNIAGISVILHMADHMADMERQINEMEEEIRRLKTI